METNKNNYRTYIYGIIAVIAGIVLDQYTKLLAVAHLKDQNSIDIIQGVFQLHYLENRGAAFGILQNQKVFFVICAAVILPFAAYIYAKMPHTKRFVPLRICMIAIASGAIGNMIDRIRLNYVVDFLYFELIDFPVFNVADIYVTLAAVFLIVLTLFYYKEEEIELLFDLLSFKHHKKTN